jgi:hypothetical protein
MKLLKQAAEKYKHVILVAGNHEYYGHCLDDANSRISAKCAAWPNVHFLNKRAITIDGVRFLGCTMWSHVEDRVVAYMNDYVRTFQSPGVHVTPDYIRAQHAEHVAWIESELSVDTETPTVIITHHAPDMRMNGRYLGNHLNSGFATDLPHLFRAPVRAWICGHTHECMTVHINGIPCTANCYGYDGENTGFDAQKCITI